MNTTMPTEVSLEALIVGDRAEFARLVDVYSSPKNTKSNSIKFDEFMELE